MRPGPTSLGPFDPLYPELPASLPIFPLTGAVLLPGGRLPLNVFEPRYLEMLDAVMAGDRLIGIIQPATDSGEEEESPRGTVGLRNVGCVGRVTSYQEVDHARRMITLTGVMRYDVLDEAVTDLPYRVMSVSYDRYASDLNEGLGEELVDRTNLLRVLRSYLDANKLEADWAAIQRASSEFLINALCVMCPYGPEEKQALLEAEDLKCRADVLVALAEMELASSGSSGTTLQ